MKAGNTDFEVGTRIRVLDIVSTDPDDAAGVVGKVGQLTHPFGDMPGTVLGVWIEGEMHERIGLCRGDQIEIIEHGLRGDTGEAKTV